MAKKRNTYSQQIADETALRFGPQQQGLLQLLDEARTQYHSGLEQSRAAADLIANMAGTQQRELAAPDNPIRALVEAHTAGAPGSAGVVSRNLGLTLGAAQSLLSQAGPQAAQAATYRAEGLRRNYTTDVGKIQQQGQALLGQIGTYGSARLGELEADATKRHQQVADLRRKTQTDLIRAGINPVTKTYDPKLNAPPKGPSTIAKPPSNYTGSEADWNALNRSARDQWVKQHPTSRGRAKSPADVKPATPAQIGTFKDGVAAAQAEATRLHQTGGHSRRYIAKTLVGGRPSKSIKDPKTLQTLTVPGVKARPQLITSIALDLAFDGHVSAANRKEFFHRYHRHINEIGYPIAPARNGRLASYPA